jgi:hypothetical protein
MLGLIQEVMWCKNDNVACLYKYVCVKLYAWMLQGCVSLFKQAKNNVCKNNKGKPVSMSSTWKQASKHFCLNVFLMFQEI